MERKIKGTIYFSDMKKALGVETVYGRYVRHSFSRHTHKALSIGIVEQGERIFWCRGEKYEIVAGRIFIIPPNEVHSCESAGEHTYRLLLVAPCLLQTILSQHIGEAAAGYTFNKLVFDDREIFDHLLDVHAVLKSSETMFVKQSVLISVVGRIIEQCMVIGEDLKISNAQSESIKNVQLFIEKHYDKCFSLSEIAQEAHLSPYYLIRVFNRITGIPPHVYQQQVRIRNAKQMLMQDIPLAEVALRTGFVDQSHFSNVFKKIVGISPGGYIKSWTVTV